MGLFMQDPVNLTMRRNAFVHNGLPDMQHSIIMEGSTASTVSNVLYDGNVFYNYGRVALRVPSTWHNVTLQNNQLQEPSSGRSLIMISQQAMFSSANNRFFSNAQTGSWSSISGVSRSIAYWNAQVNDTTSTAQAVQYPDPTRTLTTYWRSLGNATGDYNDLALALRDQRKGRWLPQYTIDAITAYMRAGYGL
jgi:hypothetical protein